MLYLTDPFLECRSIFLAYNYFLCNVKVSSTYLEHLSLPSVLHISIIQIQTNILILPNSTSVIQFPTSDGQFIHALNEASGKEIWRTKITASVWASALVAGNITYMPCNDGVLNCLNVNNGHLQPHPFVVNDKIFSSPMATGPLLFFGADNGSLYCLKTAPALSLRYQHLVYWDKLLQYNAARQNNSSLLMKSLNLKGYNSIDASSLLQLANSDTAQQQMVVMATEFLPAAFWKKDSSNTTFPLQHFMEMGNTIVALGFNPLAIDFDDSTGFYKAFNFKRAENIIGVQYNENDLRSLNGFIPATATPQGISMDMKLQFIASCPLTSSNADIVLGKDERNRIVAFIKNVGNKGCAYVQLFISRDFAEDYNFINEVIKHLENSQAPHVYFTFSDTRLHNPLPFFWEKQCCFI